MSSELLPMLQGESLLMASTNCFEFSIKDKLCLKKCALFSPTFLYRKNFCLNIPLLQVKISLTVYNTSSAAGAVCKA
jgi:hypothetical protein